jgi:hypothetical protein
MNMNWGTSTNPTELIYKTLKLDGAVASTYPKLYAVVTAKRVVLLLMFSDISWGKEKKKTYELGLVLQERE